MTSPIDLPVRSLGGRHGLADSWGMIYVYVYLNVVYVTTMSKNFSRNKCEIDWKKKVAKR